MGLIAKINEKNKHPYFCPQCGRREELGPDDKVKNTSSRALVVDKKDDRIPTLLDSCFLCCWNGMVDEACKIFGTFADLQIKEMERNDRKGLCFGGGGFFLLYHAR